ncbi:MAG: Undecaprenyl-phosphate 4-deoxy-4-formamido-L-arabinose transferase [Chroococcidiopsis cubana SAG 39.79]|uniref:Glycosyltransferase 2-like domain-containing protein n=1 Tax=Chroococcidiopsis cubana SAG 39.79 TaxID=388085 RepID=A0AB37UBD1_9CYAN|nr:glycosyltransferase family 2 protein [Chroococcidiopsis cubana]MDZ4874796.1 Undecaprenyl-phosphate 4-deoxy-4-formamido-L-arabinose transferase [Chroococcidiopsis cubana SAG 39.79]RUT04495.1 hypothetical protein DSM107010_57750 [Chroococcidiopsis cubana SAG 39.79]
MNDRPLVSILINNCNYGCYVDKAIESALNQTYSHLEVIVVDDGSIDNSREVIARYQDRVIPVLKENEGQSSALNVGFNIAKGDIICFLDADDLALLEKVSEVVNVFKNNPDIGWCFHSIKVMDMKTGKLLKRICHDNVYVTITEETKQSRSQKCDFRASMLERGKVDFIIPPTSGLCFTRSLLKQIFPLPQYKTHKTSADRCLKFSAIALSPGFFLDRELTIQRVHDCNAYTARSDRQQYMARSILIMANWMRVRFPELAKFTNKSFAKGLSIYWRTGGVEASAKELVKKYLASISILERLGISLRAVYYSLKIWER